jgi:ABC transport system ATP-binding/permease protein
MSAPEAVARGPSPGQRVVEIDGAKVGSGYIIGRGLVLTAGHVAGTGACRVRPLGTADWLSASSAWQPEDPSLDVAVLRVSSDGAGTGLDASPVRWGTPRPDEQVECEATGFPWTMAGPPGADGTQVRDTDQVWGWTVPMAGLKAGRLIVNVYPPPRPRGGGSAWAGLSGAAVLARPGGQVLGVVVAENLRTEGRITAVPAAALLADPAFAEVTCATVGDLELAGGRPSPLADPYLHLPDNSSDFLLLDSRFGIVPFVDTGGYLPELTAWCDEERPFSIGFLHGEGGRGKSRLAAELCVRMRERGWEAGIARTEADSAAWDSFDPRRPALLVFDYAEPATAVIARVAKQLYSRRSRPPVRILLVVRYIGSWRRQLRIESSSLLSDESPGWEVRALPETSADREVHAREAMAAFAEWLDLPPEPVPDVSAPAFATPLLVHAQVLLQLRGDPAPPGPGPRQILRRLVDREERRWQLALSRYGLGTLSVDTALEAVVTAAFLAPAREERDEQDKREEREDMRSLLAVVPGLADGPLRDRVLDWLTEVLPGVETLSPLGPDPVTEELLSRVQDLYRLADKLYGHGQCRPRYKARLIETLQRAAYESGPVAEVFARFQAAHPESAPLFDPLSATEMKEDEPRVRIIFLRKDVTRFGSQPQPETGDVAWERLTSPLAAPWHFTIVKKGDRLELRTRPYSHKPYIDGEPVSVTVVLTQGDSFDFAEDRYTMLDASTLRVAPTGKSNLVAANLYATSRSKVRLSGMSFVQQEQTLLAIVGPSGAGKSSLFSALLGELPLESGQLFFAGLPMATHSQQIRDQLGFVPQQIDLHMSLTVQATLRYGFGLRSPDRSKRHRDKAIENALALLKLKSMEHQLLSTLSGGQLRRVSIALELLTSPPLLLLDEPTSGLDAHMDRQIMTFLREYAETIDPEEPTKRHTVIVVTHATENLDLAHQTLVVVDDGRPAYSGPARQIRKHFGFKTYADLMSMLMDQPREWAESYRSGAAAREAVTQAAKLGQRSAGEISLAHGKVAGLRRPPSTASRRVGVLARRQCELLLSRGLTSSYRSPRDQLRRAAAVSVPLLVPAAAAALIALFAVRPYLGKHNSALAVTLLTALSVLSAQSLTYASVLDELPLIRREHRAGISAAEVITAKWIVYSVVAVIQAALITLLYCRLSGQGPQADVLLGPETDLFVSLATLSVTAATLGLLISTLVGTLEQAIAWMIFSAVTQVVLNGVIVHLTAPTAASLLAGLLPARWGVAAAVSAAGLAGSMGGTDALWHHSLGQWLQNLAALVVQCALFYTMAVWRLRNTLRPLRSRRRAAHAAHGAGRDQVNPEPPE